MKFVALISGGKDSFFNIHHCISRGHKLVALANLNPSEEGKDEINSFMFQTVGHDVVEYYEKCVGVPLYRRKIHGSSTNQELEYSVTAKDEIEDLYELLLEIKTKHPEIQGVSCGAILSNYQRTRVENVCGRLGLTSMAYLWQRDQNELMQEMCSSGLDARIIKVAAVGLGEQDLGKSIQKLYPRLLKLNEMYEVHICGEGGEFETIVFDSPVFQHHKLELVSSEIVSDSNDGVCYMKLGVDLIDKSHSEISVSESPPLLEEGFQEVAKLTEAAGNDSEHDIDLNTVGTKPFTCVSTNNKLFISNLSSTGISIEEQASSVFLQLRHILSEYSLTLDNIQHITLLLSDITKFSDINEVYSKQFEGLFLPPSRVCIETILAQGQLINLSAIVLKNNSSKSGIHIRSISYWAPQNIGPYSQSLVESRDKYKLATLSGQIPLIPSSMMLSEHSSSFNSTLSLQHLHRVKELVNVKRLASVTAFVTQRNLLPVVSSTWSQYGGLIEDVQKDSLVILQVKDLPKHADIEWSGISYENIVGLYDDFDDDDSNDSSQLSSLRTDSVMQCIEQFEQHAQVVIGKESVKILTLFTNSLENVKNLILQNDGTNFLQIITTSDSARELHNAKLNKFDLLTALGVYNYQSHKYSFACILILEL